MSGARSTLRAQLGLFDQPPPGSTPSASRTAGRRMLDEHSWVDHFHGWLADPEALFVELAALTGWEQRSRWMFTRSVIEPRLTAEFHVLADAPVAEVGRIGARLSQQYGVDYDSAWMNLYRDQNDSTAWHADRPANRAPTSVVPVLSLGATRRFSIRPRDGGRSESFVVSAGDLIVMGGRCQRDWVHAVPKETAPSGPRISVNFGSRSQSIDEARGIDLREGRERDGRNLDTPSPSHR